MDPSGRSPAAVWEWQTGSGWTAYDTRQQHRINAAYDNGDDDYSYSTQIKGETVEVRIAFGEMKQYTGRHRCRNVRKVDADDGTGYPLPKIGARGGRLVAPVEGDSWEWLSDGGWQPYPDDVIEELNIAKHYGATDVTVTIKGTEVVVDLVKGVQRTGPHKSRPVRFVQVSTAAGVPKPLAAPAAAAPAAALPDLATPKHWKPRKTALDKFFVDLHSAEAKKVLGPFHNTIGRGVTVQSLVRVQNYALWGFYALMKKHIEQQNRGNANEKKLFHGARLKPNMDAIINNGFDMRVAAAGAVGVGIYFAVCASYSDSGFALTNADGSKELFISRVLCGNSCVGNSALRRPPPVNASKPNGLLYDSVTDSTSPVMYVVFDNKQAYPEYIVKYK